MQNPYKYDVLNPEVSRVLESGGTVEITGGLKNGTFNKLYKMSEAELQEAGYTLVSKREIPNPVKGNRTDGEPVRGSVFEIVLRKN